MKALLRYPSVVLTAIVAGVFSTLVCALLLVDFARRSTEVTTESPAYLALKAKLAGDPDNQQLREQIRQIDLQLRQAYFRQQQFTLRGGYLLLGGVALALVMAKRAATLRRRLPTPAVQVPGQDPEAQQSHRALWAVFGLALLLVGTSWGLHTSYRSQLPRGLNQQAEVPGSAAAIARQPPQAAALPSQTEVPPTADQIARSWPRFRGPNGDGVSAYSNVPIAWDGASGAGIRWKTPVPLPGANSPVVWQDRVFLSGATAQRREVYCFDAHSGKLLWASPAATQAPPPRAPHKVNQDTGYAAPTTATDGRRVYAMFASGDLAAFDFAGKEVWTRSFGLPQNPYGHASSLATFDNLLLVQIDQGSAKDAQSKLRALDGATGNTVWEITRQVPSSWSSPIVIDHAGQPQLITSAEPWVIAYALPDGQEIWRADCMRGEIGPSPVYRDGCVYVANEAATLTALRAGGQGDVSQTHIQWAADYGLPDTCSPLVTDQFVLLMASYGTLTCYDREVGGEPLWEEEFDEDFMSSPSLVGERVYLFSAEGKTWIVEPGPQQCKRIAEADLGEACMTSPAFQDGRIYIRGEQHLFCVGEKENETESDVDVSAE